MLSYDSFKPNIPFASTQQISAPSNDFKMPHPIVNTEELKMKLTYLQQKCEAKEGEVSILRSQMKKMKTEMAEEQSKKQKEHLEITNLKEKQIKSIKGQLDFKVSLAKDLSCLFNAMNVFTGFRNRKFETEDNGDV